MESRKSPTSEELAHIKDAYNKADPTKFSLLDPTEVKKDTDSIISNERKFIDTDTNEILYRITKKPEVQKFIASITKGILSSSDVVQKCNQYYSRNLDLRKVEPKKLDEFFSEVFILIYLFSDFDKSLFANTKILENERNGAISFSHFDYEMALSNPVPQRDESESIVDFIYDQKRLHDIEIGPAFFELAIQKLQSLKSVFSDTDFYYSVAEKSNMEVNFPKSRMSPHAYYEVLRSDALMKIDLLVQNLQTVKDEAQKEEGSVITQ